MLRSSVIWFCCFTLPVFSGFLAHAQMPGSTSNNTQTTSPPDYVYQDGNLSVYAFKNCSLLDKLLGNCLTGRVLVRHFKDPKTKKVAFHPCGGGDGIKPRIVDKTAIKYDSKECQDGGVASNVTFLAVDGKVKSVANGQPAIIELRVCPPGKIPPSIKCQFQAITGKAGPNDLAKLGLPNTVNAGTGFTIFKTQKNHTIAKGLSPDNFIATWAKGPVHTFVVPRL